jgi:hypothetical protein
MNSQTYSTHDDKYLITSYGNGWAYEVEDIRSGFSFWVQDDEASDLRRFTNDFEDTHTLAEYMFAMGEPCK